MRVRSRISYCVLLVGLFVIVLATPVEGDADIEFINLEAHNHKGVDRGANVSYMLLLTNNGSGTDNVSVELMDQDSSEYGLLVVADDGNQTGKMLNITLDPDENATIEYILYADEDYIQDSEIEQFEETIRATSGLNSSVFIELEFVTHVFEANYTIDVNFQSIVTTVRPTEDEHNSTVNFTVENTGDHEDDIMIRVSETPDLEDPSLIPGDTSWIKLRYGDQVGAGTSLTIEDMDTGTVGTIELEFDVGTEPVDALAGNYSYMIKVESKGGGPQDNESRFWTNVTLTVEEVADFEWDMDITEATIDPSGLDRPDEVEVSLSIENKGNFEDEFTVKALSLPTDLDVDFDGKGPNGKFRIDPDNELVIPMTVSAENDTREGELTFQIRISSLEGDVSETQNFTVTVVAPNIQITEDDITLSKPVYYINESDEIMVFVRVWNNGSGPIADLEVKFLIGSRVSETSTIEELRAERFKDISFDWTIGNTTQQIIRIQTTGALPNELNIGKTYDFSNIVEGVPSEDDEDKGGSMEIVLAITAVVILVLVVIGLLLVQSRKK